MEEAATATRTTQHNSQSVHFYNMYGLFMYNIMYNVYINDLRRT